jgi:DNA-binding transcriptional MocR family regulator
MKLQIEPGAAVPIVEQVIAGVRSWVDCHDLRAGARLPSIRRLAADYRISRTSVIEAYERLVAQGLLYSRQGAGFFVAERPVVRQPGQGSSNPELAGEVTSQLWHLFNDESENLKLGCGWLPDAWRDADDLAYAIRQVTRHERAGLFDYSTPLGCALLRQHVQRRMQGLRVDVDPAQIMLTSGASHALDLLIRYLLKPGDVVFVETPGYYNLFGLLKLQGVQMVGVPRGEQGPDPEALERLLAQHQPKLFFVNSVFQNPTGTTLTPAVAHRVLQLAERHRFTVVEDDIYADFQAEPTIRLAALDQLQRVIYLGSYSKSLSCSLRVGFIAGAPALIKNLVDMKMLTSIASSRFAEQVVAAMLENGSYRKLVDRLRQRMGRQMAAVLPQLEKAGWEIFAEPAGGMFVWARRPEQVDAGELVAQASAMGISLSNGSIFTPDMADCPWLRVNVTYASDPRAQAFLFDRWPQPARESIA